MSTRSIGIVTFLIIVAPTLFAQAPKAVKIDEFGNTNCDDYRARMDNSLNQLNEHPEAKGYVFVYEGDLERRVSDEKGGTRTVFIPSERGIAKGLIGYFTSHLALRNFPADRIVFVNAGFRERMTIESWLVPKGAEIPTPAPTVKKVRQRTPKRNPWGFCGEM